MRLNPLLRRVAEQSHLFDVVSLEASGCQGVGWRFRGEEGVGQVDFLQVSRNLLLDISDFRCFEDKRLALSNNSAPLLKMRFKLSGCSLLHFKDGDVSMLGEHCSVSAYSPKELQHERLTRNVAERSVTLHCDESFFQQDLGLDPDHTPEPVRSFLLGRSGARCFDRARLSARMRQTTIELMKPGCAPPLTRAFREVKARDLALSMLVLLSEQEGRSSRSASSVGKPAATLAAHDLRRATDWLHENLTDDADVAALARVIGTDPIRLARAFKHSTGFSVGQYRLRARVERAKQLLVEGQLPIKAVSQEAGFYDQAHLTRAFRAAFGTTPLQYRNDFARRPS
jgi:AraC-like DNA-binding protein